MGNRFSHPSQQHTEQWSAANTDISRIIHDQDVCDDLVCKEEPITGLDDSYIVIERKRKCQGCLEARENVTPLRLVNMLQDLNASQCVILLEDAGFRFSRNWENVARRLNIPSEKRNEQLHQSIHVDQNYPKALECCLDYWIANDIQKKEVLWSRFLLAIAAYESDTADKIRKRVGLYSQDTSTKLQRKCDETFLNKLNAKLSQFSCYYRILAPCLLSESEVTKISGEVPEHLKILSMLHHWRDCWDDRATYEALVCILKHNSSECELHHQRLIDMIVSYVKNPSSMLDDEETEPFFNIMSEEDRIKHKKATRRIQRRFSEVVAFCSHLIITCDSVKITEIKPYIVTRCYREMYAKAATKEELMTELCINVSWFNFDLLQELIERYGDEASKQKVAQYNTELDSYLKGKCVLQLPRNTRRSTQISSSVCKICIKIPDFDLQQPDVDGLDARIMKAKFAERLEIPLHEAEFVESRPGCIEVVLAVPVSAVNDNPAQKNLEWNEYLQEYQFTGNLLEILPNTFSQRNRALTDSLLKSTENKIHEPESIQFKTSITKSKCK